MVLQITWPVASWCPRPLAVEACQNGLNFWRRWRRTALRDSKKIPSWRSRRKRFAEMAGQTLSSTGHGGRDEKGGFFKRREEPSEVVYMLFLKEEYHDAVFLKNVFFCSAHICCSTQWRVFWFFRHTQLVEEYWRVYDLTLSLPSLFWLESCLQSLQALCIHKDSQINDNYEHV